MTREDRVAYLVVSVTFKPAVEESVCEAEAQGGIAQDLMGVAED